MAAGKEEKVTRKETLRDELTDYRTSRPADLKLEGGFFYRKTFPDKSANYNGAYPDLYNNSDDEHIIQGGQKSQFSQFDTKLATSPTYGSGDLSGLFFCTKVKTVENSPLVLDIAAPSNPGLKSFYIDTEIMTEGGTTDGSSMIYHDTLTAYSSMFTSTPSWGVYNEIFDGVGEEETTDVVQGNLIVKRQPYLTLDDAFRHGRRNGKKGGRLFRLKRKKFRNRWCNYDESLGEYICRIKRKFTGAGCYGPIWMTTKYKKLPWNYNREIFKLSMHNGLDKLIKYKSEVPIPTDNNPYTVTRSNLISSNNSTLHSTKEARTFRELQKDGGLKEIAWGRISFSSEAAVEGGQSCKLHTFWPALSNSDGWRRTNIFYPADSTNNHTQMRQECYIVKRLPVPKVFQDMQNPSDATKVGSNVEVKLNMKKLAPCESKYYMRDGSARSNTYVTGQKTISRLFTRGLAICLSEFPPGHSNYATKTPDDTFYTFMKRHHPDMETNGADGAHGDNTNAKDFMGLFLTNERGTIIPNILGKHASTNNLTFHVDHDTHKIGKNTTPADTQATSDISMDDRWLSFNFIIDSESGGCEVVITDASDGTAIQRLKINNSSGAATNTQGTFPRYLSIWNVNYPNPNSGMPVSSKRTDGLGTLNDYWHDRYKDYSDTGLVLHSIEDPASSESRVYTFYSASSGGTNNTTAPDNICVADRITGDTTGSNEKYWCWIAGSYGWLITMIPDNDDYVTINSNEQYESEAKYGDWTVSNGEYQHTAGEPIAVKNDRPIDGGIPGGEDAESIVYVDSIKLHNFSMDITNCTVSNFNTNQGRLKIPRTHRTYNTAYANIAAWNGDDNVGPMNIDTWNYWSLGFESADHIEGAQRFFMCNGFSSQNDRNNSEILNSYDSDNSHIRVGYAGDASTADLGEHTGIAMFHNNDGSPVGGDDSTGRGLTVGRASFENAALKEFAVGGAVNYVDGFTQKGIFDVNFTERTNEPLTSRENPYCAARITELISVKKGQIKVDNKYIFRMDTNTEYIMYRDGQTYGPANYLSGLKVLEIDDESGVVTLNKALGEDETGSGTNDFANEANIGSLYISPKKFWLVIAFLNKSADDDATYLPERNYTSITPITAVGTAGATLNEYTFSDNTNYTFKREMDPFDLSQSNDVRNDIDFGYGPFDEDLETGGYCGKVNIQSDATSLTPRDHFRQDISGIIKAVKPELGKTISLLLTSLSAEDETEHTIAAEESSNTYDKPYLLTEFKDSLPVITEFTVEPERKNNFYPHYKWQSQADDTWYGFLNIDSSNIYHQYHNAVVHMPLNEEDIDAKLPASVPVEQISGLTNTISGVLKDVEGLGGYCLNFDGNDDYVEVNNSPSSDPTGDCTKEMTVLVHIVPDNASDSRYVIAQSSRDDREKFHIRLNTSNQVEARAYFDGGANYVDLKSSSIIPCDGETPTCIILTVDTEIPAGNVKLYINGNLEDQSGQTTSSGGTNNWKEGATINGGNSEIYIGNSASSGTNGFDGKIEEVVIYKKVLYPFGSKATDMILTKPFVELDDTSTSSSLSINAKIFIKDYHNIRGKLNTQVATAPAVSFRKAAFRLDNS